jgi:signal transduction histidine kinase
MSAKPENAAFPTTNAKPCCIPALPSRRTDIITVHQQEEDNPAWMQSSILTDANRDMGLPLYEILAITDLMREAYADRALDSLQMLLSLLSLKTAHYASSFSSIIEAAKSESAAKDLVIETIDLALLMQEVTQATRIFLGNKSVSIMEVASSSHVLIRSDRVKIKQLITGLMSNAAKFTHRGRIALILNKDDDRVRFTITDTGIGMTAKQIKALFNPSDSAAHNDVDTLSASSRGLRMVMNLLTQLKGSISVSSKVGEGTIAEVSLPLEPPVILTNSGSIVQQEACRPV